MGQNGGFPAKNGKTFFNFFLRCYLMPCNILRHIRKIIFPFFGHCKAVYHARSAEKQFFNDSEKTTHPPCGVLVVGIFAA